MRQDNDASNREQMAEEIYNIYIQEYQDEQHRLGLPSMNKLRYIALMDFLTSPFYPDELKNSLMARIRIEKPELEKKLMEQGKLFMKEAKKQQLQQP